MNTKQNRPTSLPTHYLTSNIRKNPYKKTSAVKELERLANEDAQRKNPTIPLEWLAPRKYADNNTSALTKCVYDLLKLKGHHVERTGNEGRIIDNRKTYTDVVGRQRTIGSVTRIKSSGMNGTSDLKCSLNGRFIAIEIKCLTTNDKQSDSQKQYQQVVEASGGIYLVIQDFQQFYDWYCEFTGGQNHEN